jgi:hypothetical protein
MAFAVAPTSKRVVEDILTLPMVLDRIIEQKGTVVEDEAQAPSQTQDLGVAEAEQGAAKK